MYGQMSSKRTLILLKRHYSDSTTVKKNPLGKISLSLSNTVKWFNFWIIEKVESKVSLKFLLQSINK